MSARSHLLYHGNRVVLCNWLFRSNIIRTSFFYKDGSVATFAHSGAKSAKHCSVLNFCLLGQCAMALSDDLDIQCSL